MPSAGHGMRIKYGLRDNPSADQQSQWARLVRRYIDQGWEREAAGHRAAADLFPDYKTRVYAAEADTLEALLRAAEER